MICRGGWRGGLGLGAFGVPHWPGLEILRWKIARVDQQARDRNTAGWNMRVAVGGRRAALETPTRPCPRPGKRRHTCRHHRKAKARRFLGPCKPGFVQGCAAARIRRHGRGGRGVYVPVVGVGQGHGLPTPRHAVAVVTRCRCSYGMGLIGFFPSKKCPKTPLARQRFTGSRNVHCSVPYASRGLRDPTAHCQAPIFHKR